MGEHESHDEEHGSSGHGSHGAGGHGGGHAEGEHEGAPEWLISFADNVALLMGFFVILLAMNMAPKSAGPMGGKGEGGGSSETRMIDFVISIREGFNRPFDLTSKKAEDQPYIRRILERKGGEGVNDGPTGRRPETTSTDRGQHRNVAASIAFDDNSAALRPGAKSSLIDIAHHLRDQGWIIDVRGHVSPFEARNLGDAMELSKNRAMAVATALVENGVKKTNVRLVLCADHDRMVPRAFDAEAARTNQRVEIVVTNEPVPVDPHSTTSVPTTSGESESTDKH